MFLVFSYNDLFIKRTDKMRTLKKKKNAFINDIMCQEMLKK